MWTNNFLKDILPLIAKKLNRKDSLNIIQVCSFWRNTLKQIITNKYPIIIKKEDDYSSLDWCFISCYVSPCPKFKRFDILRISRINNNGSLNCDLLPKEFKTLDIRISRNFKIEGSIPNFKKLYFFGGKEFPYFLLHPNINSLVYSSIESNYPKEIDFKKLNISKYKNIYIGNKTTGNPNLLDLSFDTLESLQIRTEFSDLKKFYRLSDLSITTNNIKILDLPKTLKILHINAVDIDFLGIEQFENIKNYSIGVLYYGKISFPPNITNCKISRNCSGFNNKFPESVTKLSCYYNHLNILGESKINQLKVSLLNARILKYPLKFPLSLRELNIYGYLYINDNTFDENLKITSLKFSFPLKEVNLNYLPTTLRKLIINKKQIFLINAKMKYQLHIIKNLFYKIFIK